MRNHKRIMKRRMKQQPQAMAWRNVAIRLALRLVRWAMNRKNLQLFCLIKSRKDVLLAHKQCRILASWAVALLLALAVLIFRMVMNCLMLLMAQLHWAITMAIAAHLALLIYWILHSRRPRRMSSLSLLMAVVFLTARHPLSFARVKWVRLKPFMKAITFLSNPLRSRKYRCPLNTLPTRILVSL